MSNFLLVALGGGLGAAGRYGVSLALPAKPGEWPWATFSINVLGSLLIGVLAGWLSTRGEAGEPWRLFLGVGVLGGFTTFSAYSLETLRMVERGEWPMAIMYALGSVLAGLAAVAIGAEVARRIAV
jgi:fluoride exporter